MSGELSVTRVGSVTRLTIRRPDKRNALGLGLIDALRTARDDEAARGTQVVVLTAEPANGIFCAGFDTDVLAEMAARGAGTTDAASPLHDLFASLEDAPFSLITAISGRAFGGGVELALLGDVRIAVVDATFTLPPAKLGIVYPDVGLRRLERALGPSLLGAMLATAQPVSAARLSASGVLWSLEDDVVDAATKLATSMAALPSAGRIGNRDALRVLTR